MIKLVAAVRRRPGMTHAEYTDYVENVHGGIALDNKLTIRKYVQNHVFDAAYGTKGDIGYHLTMPRDSVTELYFDDPAAMERTFSDPYTRDVVGPDGAKFSDEPAALSLLVEEQRTGAPVPGNGTVKVLHFVKAADGTAPDAFRQGLRRAHEDVLADSSGPARHLLGHEWNEALPGDGMADYFGGDAETAYEGYSALWFDEAEALTAFRAYEEALAARADQYGAKTDPSGSFFLLTREVVIFDDLGEADTAA
ncbi:EthD domain-containing protein [Streptomyces rishiriensis]|uniref:EthD domain-containing protein n=1 Tax=Streptomyces rishiriensis TaxID=68264 RepID=A0ABU0NG47_STRRH|nr:EthD domain-containing protein [Streptomyces rishiriensis]MDQ0578025.1 hypothetical protein [Streptomyces rishiriensis]